MKRLYHSFLLLLLLVLASAGYSQAQTADVSTTVNGPNIATIGTSVTYNVVLFNNGPSATTVNSYTVQLVPGLTGVSSSATYRGTTYANPGTYSATTGTYSVAFSFALDNAEQVTGAITFTMPATNVTGKVSCTSTGTTDPNANNNNGTSVSANITTASTTRTDFDLATTLGGPAQLVSGQPATFTVVTDNNGPAPASNVTQTIQLPLAGGAYPVAGDVTVTGGTYSTTTGRVTFTTVASLPNDGVVNNSVTYVPRTVGSYTLTGAATASGTDLTTANNSQNLNITVNSLAGVGSSPGPCANPGRDGSPTALATNPNTYFPSGSAAQTVNAGSNSISLGTARGAGPAIAAGDLVLIIQMQGAAINSSNNNSYGDGVAGGSGNGFLNDANFRAGRYEYAVAASAVPTTGGPFTLTLTSNLVNSYEQGAATTTLGQRSFQVVRVPQYANLTLGGNLTALAWDGSTGGLLALDVALTLNPNGFKLNADGVGFRGGAGRKLAGDGNTTTLLGTDYVSVTTKNANGTKGEGLAGTPQYLNNAGVLLNTAVQGYPGGDNGRGAPGNAGGGGTDANPAANDQNTGGGGGSNGGNGGRGGNSWSSNQSVGGEPAAYFSYVAGNRLVLGGGGGAGTTNNGTGLGGNGFSSSGAAGGGIILVRTGAVSGTGTFSANGAAANTDIANDGAGGGGAGGSVLVTARNTAGLSGLTLTATGGNGGGQTTGAAHGPGGGGGGGIVLANAAVGSTSVAGGANGLYKTTTTDAGVAFGSAPGTAGYANTSLGSSIITNATAGTDCVADVATTISGPASAAAGQPTGNFTATFTNNGGAAAVSTTQTVTLPTGAGLSAAQRATIVAAYPGTTFGTTGSGAGTVTIINFGTVTALASGASNSFVFAYTAPAAAGTATTASATSTTTTELGQTANNLASTTTTIVAAADVTVSLTGPTTLSAGQPTGSFTATFTNEGPQPASNVTQTVTLPTGASVSTTQQNTIKASYAAATFSTTGSGATAVTTINFGTATTLASDAANTFTFVFTAPAATGSTTLGGNTSTATSEGSNLAPNAASLAITTSALADATAVISAGAVSVAPGQTATFNVTFDNAGTQDAANAVRTVQLPTGLSGVSATNGGTYSSTTGLVTYLTSTQTTTDFTSAISFTMPASGPVTATASISTTTGESSTANNSAVASIAVAPQFDLTTALSGPAAAVAGSPVTLSVTTTNNGPLAASGVVQTVTLAAGLGQVFVSNNGSYDNTTGVVTFPTLSSLPNGQTVANTISFVAPATAFAPSALVTPNTTGAGETNTANNTAFLNGAAASTSLATSAATATQANVYTTISTPSGVVKAGDVVTFTVVAGNNGPSAASTVTERVQLLPGFSTTTIKVAGAAGTLSGNVITFPNGATYNTATGLLSYSVSASLASGASASFTIDLTAPGTVGNNGQLLALASVSSATSDPVPADNAMAAAVTVTPATDLVATIAGPASPAAGQLVSYTATFANNGPSAATTVAETAQLPTGLSGVVVKDASGATLAGAYSATTGLVTFPAQTNMAAGASQAFTVAFTAPAQSYSVVAAIGSSTTEATVTNNVAPLAATVSATADVAVAIAGPTTAVAGNPVTYLVATTNNGPSPAASVSITLQLPAGLSGVTVSSGSYDNASGLVTFASTASLAVGSTVSNYATFTMPAGPTNGLVSGQASVSTTTAEATTSNNTAGATTSVAPATIDALDLTAAITPPSGPVAPGAALSYTFAFGNAGAVAATSVVPTASLPAGLSGVTVSNGGSYNSTTGLVTWPTIASQAAGTTAGYTVSFAAPGSGPLVAAASVSSSTSESNSANNVASSSLAITAAYDVVTALNGPASALPGSGNVYAVTTTNNGPSTAPSVTQTVTLPTGVTATNLPAGASQSGNIVTFAVLSNLPAGASVTRTFTLTMPASGSLAASATVAAAGESNTGNDVASLTTTATNLPPVAQNVLNTLQNVRGNTATALAISGLNAADTDGTIASYIVTAIPAAAQGVLSYNNGGTYTAVANGQPLTPAQAASLRFAPATGFAGNGFFSYTSTDNTGAVSNVALYTVPVAQDLSSTYGATTAKGGTSKYATNDVLAFVVDPNTDLFTNGGASPGTIYSTTTGALQSGAANGLPTTGTNAVLAASGSGPAQNPTNALPAGTALNPTTGQIYVSNASLLPRINAATTYYVNVITTDLNGGTNVALAQFTLGAYPLPVTLVSFTALAKGSDAQLAWTTAQELNNDHFDVERSLDGATFAKVGQLAGHGSTSSASSYAFTDAGIGSRATGPVYYRLRQVDVDGTATYSPVRTVAFAASIAPAISLYPNPAAQATQLDLSLLPAGTYQVQVLDLAGRVVLRQSATGATAPRLDLSPLASGSYLVQVQGQGLNLAKRLTKE
jgi:uncharacterized repeat protein (TIGR01451 family)